MLDESSSPRAEPRAVECADRVLTTEPAPSNPNSTRPNGTIAIATAPPDTAYADCAISIADAAHTNSGTVAIKSTPHADCCRPISVPTSSIIAAIAVVHRICVGRNWSRIPVVRGEGSKAVVRAIIRRRTIAIISAAARTLCLGRARREYPRSSDCCRVKQLLHRSPPHSGRDEDEVSSVAWEGQYRGLH